MCAAGCPWAIQLFAGPGALLEDMLHCLFARPAVAVCGRGQSDLPAHAEVEAVVIGSKPEKDYLLSSVETVVFVPQIVLAGNAEERTS